MLRLGPSIAAGIMGVYLLGAKLRLSLGDSSTSLGARKGRFGDAIKRLQRALAIGVGTTRRGGYGRHRGVSGGGWGGRIEGDAALGGRRREVVEDSRLACGCGWVDEVGGDRGGNRKGHMTVAVVVGKKGGVVGVVVCGRTVGAPR